MIEQIGFDPLEFSTMNPTDQGKKLLSIFPTKINLAENASFHKAAYDDRAVSNREIKRLSALINSAPLPDPELPTEEVSISALSTESAYRRKELDQVHDLGNKLNNMNAQITRSQEQEKNLAAQLETKLEALRNQMAALEKDCEAQIKSERERRDGLEHQRSELKKTEVREPATITLELTALDQKIQNAEKTNSEVRQGRELKKTHEQLAAAETESNRLTEQMKKLSDDRAQALKDAQFPVPGLSIGLDGNVLLNDVPFTQASMAQKLIVGIAIAAASKSNLRVCLIRDASLLDAKSMKIVEQMAIEKDIQIWMERVEDNSPCAVQIVEGSNIGATDAPEVSEPSKGAEKAAKQEPEFALGGPAPVGKKRGKKSDDNINPFKA